MRAFVLRKKAYGDSDWIVDFLLASGQVTTGFARSARNSKKRFPHQFYALALYDLEFGKSRSELPEIKTCESIGGGPEMSLESLARWSVLCEFFLKDRESGFRFESIEKIFYLLAKGEGLSEYFQFFLEQLHLHGLHPELQVCMRCHQLASDENLNFSILDGGIVHSRCRVDVPLTTKALKFLRGEDSTCSPSEVRVLDHILVPFLSAQMGWELKSAEFLLQLSSPSSIRPVDRAPPRPFAK